MNVFAQNSFEHSFFLSLVFKAVLPDFMIKCGDRILLFFSGKSEEHDGAILSAFFIFT